MAEPENDCVVEMCGDTGRWHVVLAQMNEAKACLGAIMVYQQSKQPIRVRRLNSTFPILEL